MSSIAEVCLAWSEAHNEAIELGTEASVTVGRLQPWVPDHEVWLYGVSAYMAHMWDCGFPVEGWRGLIAKEHPFCSPLSISLELAMVQRNAEEAGLAEGGE